MAILPSMERLECRDMRATHCCTLRGAKVRADFTSSEHATDELYPQSFVDHRTRLEWGCAPSRKRWALKLGPRANSRGP